MELRHLRYFVAVAELENVSRAALRLHVSQPAVSRQIRDLEEEIGFALLLRSAKSVRLTDAGRTFLGEARAVLQRTEDAVAAARASASGPNGEINVGYAPTPTAPILPLILRSFQAELPRVRVRLHDLSTEEMLSGLGKGSLQAALLVKPSRATLRGLSFVAIAHDPASVAMAPGHPLASQSSVTVSQLAEQPLVAYSRKMYPEYHERLVALFKSVHRRPRIVEEHEGGASMVAAVEAGYGLALTTRSLGCSVGARLKILPITPEPPPIVVGVAWSKGSDSPALRQFVACARAAGRPG